MIRFNGLFRIIYGILVIFKLRVEFKIFFGFVVKIKLGVFGYGGYLKMWVLRK